MHLLLESMPKLENMTTTELCGWLKEIKIKDKYIKYFEEHDINGSVLITCEADDLKGLGISEGFIRKKIVAKCKGKYPHKYSEISFIR